MIMTEALNISIQKTESTRIKEVDFNNLQFGKAFGDHMFMIDYENNQWQNAQILPYHAIQFSPSLMSLHYGQSIFEGMKAYRTPDNEILIFRPERNAKRLNISAERMCMPELPEEIFIEALCKLIEIDQDWVPQKEGSTLYLRPFMFASDEHLGAKISDSYKFMIISSPVGAYYSEPIRVKIEMDFARAVKGGVGAAKTAGNYGASFYPTQKAKEQGYDQLIWTDGQNHQFIEESGTMNVFFKINDTIVTPSLDGAFLAGITRDSLIQLAKDMGYKVEERAVEVKEIVTALENGTLKEAFGAGTAAVATPIRTIGYQGTDFDLSVTENNFSIQVKKLLMDIQTGKTLDKHSWMCKVC